MGFLVNLGLAVLFTLATGALGAGLFELGWAMMHTPVCR